MRGCKEHNFVATSLLDKARRMHRPLYVVWYDVGNAFGALPQAMLWRVLRELGVDDGFVARCAALYDGAAFAIGNAADGATRAIEQRLGVFQGCPLSPLLFIAATAPLLQALERVPDTGVALAADVSPCATAYADDFKIFSSSSYAIARAHGVVERFLAWVRLRANPVKCADLAMRRNALSNPEPDKSVTLRLDGEFIPSLSPTESYTYLGVGDGFEHVRHRQQLEPSLVSM